MKEIHKWARMIIGLVIAAYAVYLLLQQAPTPDSTCKSGTGPVLTVWRDAR